MNVSAQSHATAGHDEKVVQPGSPGQTGQAAVGQGLSRRVSAQAPTSRQLADCEAGVTACERKSLASRWNHCCRTLEPWAMGGLEGLVIGAAIGGASCLLAGTLPGILLLPPLGAAAFAIMMPGGLIGCFAGIPAGAALGCMTHNFLKRKLKRVTDKVSEVWAHYAQPDSLPGPMKERRSLVSRACHKIIPYVDAGMCGTVFGATIGVISGSMLGAVPGVILLSPPIAAGGAVLGAGCGLVAGGIIGCLIDLDEQRTSREERERWRLKKEQWNRERPERLRRRQEQLQKELQEVQQELCAEHTG